MSSTDAHIYEIFSSIQGEGIYVGDRHLFIRFSGCNIECSYCDTSARVIDKVFRTEEVPGSGIFKKYNNPVSAAQLMEFIKIVDKGKGINSAICLTGGEPLLQVDFLKNFLPNVSGLNMFVYLETNGTLPNHLKEIIDLIDIIAMDIKLPSSTGLSPYFDESKKCLEIAKQKDVFVKVIFSKESTNAEIIESAKLVASVDDKIPFVLQPVTQHGSAVHRPTPEMILNFHSIVSKQLKNVKVIPQVHKILSLS